MDPAAIELLLNEVREGKTDVPAAFKKLRHLPFEDLGFAKLDHHRTLRRGRKDIAAGGGNFRTDGQSGGNVLATRASREAFEAVAAVEPRAVYHETARAITLKQADPVLRALDTAPPLAAWPLCWAC